MYFINVLVVVGLKVAVIAGEASQWVSASRNAAEAWDFLASRAIQSVVWLACESMKH